MVRKGCGRPGSGHQADLEGHRGEVYPDGVGRARRDHRAAEADEEAPLQRPPCMAGGLRLVQGGTAHLACQERQGVHCRRQRQGCACELPACHPPGCRQEAHHQSPGGSEGTGAGNLPGGQEGRRRRDSRALEKSAPLRATLFIMRNA